VTSAPSLATRVARPGSPLQYVSTLARVGAASDLVGHFVLGSPPPFVPDGWATATLGKWTVAADRALPIRPLVDRGARQVGWILGHPLVPGSPSPIPPEIAVDAGPADLDAIGLDERLSNLAGRWVALAVEADAVVPDGSATLPVLFDRETELVSSSPFLLQGAGEDVPDHPLASVVRTFDTGLWFLFNTTPHARAERLLANHTLDLGAWKQSRRWPTSRFVEVDLDDAVARVVELLGGTLRAALADAGRVNCSLTAGGDTRSILAAARPLVGGIHTFTVAFPDFLGRRDLRVARRLARRFDLEHRVLEWRPPADADVARFMYRTGGLVGEGRGRLAGPTYAQLGPALPYVAGVTVGVGDVREDIGWRPDDHVETPLTPADVLRRFSSPAHPLLLDCAADWLARVSHLDSLEKLSLLSDELRLGAWGGALTTAYPDAYAYTLYPFASRRLKEAVYALDHAHRTSDAVREEVVRARWPELLDVPLNPLGLRDRLGRHVHNGRDAGRAAWRRTRTIARRGPLSVLA
jgi:hypothetical protein